MERNVTLQAKDTRYTDEKGHVYYAKNNDVLLGGEMYGRNYLQTNVPMEFVAKFTNIDTSVNYIRSFEKPDIVDLENEAPLFFREIKINWK